MNGGEFASYDPRNPPRAPARALFSIKPVKMEFASQQAGRPIFEDREFVQILIPGDRNASAHELVTDTHRERWPAEYAAFREGREAPLSGTPLTEWPSSHMTPARVAELAYFNVKTVEDLAQVSDAHVQNLGLGAREMRAAAQKFLEVARTGMAPLERMLAETQSLRDEVARLSADRDRLATRLTELAARADAPKEAANA